MIKPPHEFLAVDPGMNTGWASWQSPQKELRPRPDETGLITSKKKEWLERTEDICQQFARVLDRIRPHQVYCEFAEFMQSEGGMTTLNTGALVKLCFHTGRLAGICDQFGAQFIPVTVGEWKGQLTKVACQYRLKQLLPGFTVPSHHVWDAVGIGLYALGRF